MTPHPRRPAARRPAAHRSSARRPAAVLAGAVALLASALVALPAPGGAAAASPVVVAVGPAAPAAPDVVPDLAGEVAREVAPGAAGAVAGTDPSPVRAVVPVSAEPASRDADRAAGDRSDLSTGARTLVVAGLGVLLIALLRAPRRSASGRSSSRRAPRRRHRSAPS